MNDETTKSASRGSSNVAVVTREWNSCILVRCKFSQMFSFLTIRRHVKSSLLVFYGFGWVFTESKLFANYEVRNNVVRVVFAVLFALSCEVFELIIFEILDVLNREWDRSPNEMSASI